MRIFTLLLALMLSSLFMQAQNGTPCPGEPTVTYEGQTYNTIVVGNRCWLKENLNVGTMIPTGQNQANNGTIEKYCYDDLPANCETYGGLYQWKEAMQYSATPDAQGICPPGWRIPTDDEWKMLEGAADSQFDFGDAEWDNMNFRGSDAGKNLKALNGWMYNRNGLDDQGAAILPGGHRDFCGTYYSEGHSNYLWTSTEQSDQTAWYRILSSNSMQVSRRYAHKNMGTSVRCVKDYEPAPPTYNLNLEVSPAGAGTVTGAGQYEAGEQVNITAEANTGWEFVNWTDDDGIVSEAANFTYPMAAADVTLMANFVEEQVGFTCGDPLFDTRDGQTYATVSIGVQCWMAENLKYLPSVAGTGTGSGTTPYYYVYGYNGTDVNAAKATANYHTYGALYNWPASLTACPAGWHLPADDEWTALTTYVSSQPEYLCNSNTSWIAKSLAATTNWLTHTGTCRVGNNLSANNATGFSGLPGGYRNTNGSFYYLGEDGNWWSASEDWSPTAWIRYTTYASTTLGKLGHSKGFGFSARCVRGETPPPPTYNLNLDVTPKGVGTVTGAGQYQAGELINLTADAIAGWVFANWTDDDGIASVAANFTYTMPAKDVTLTANFVEEQVGFTCGTPFTDSRDGQSYATVQIGIQCWMAENLAYLPAVSPSSQGKITDPYYYVYGYQGTDVNAAKETENYNNYGTLYNWPASLNACPEGWHLPTDTEWNILTTYLGGESVAGGKMKSKRTVPAPHPRWNSPNAGATNSSGFTGLPGGYRSSNTPNSFYSLGISGKWWSSTGDSYTTTYAYIRKLYYEDTYYSFESNSKDSGISVRCLRD